MNIHPFENIKYDKHPDVYEYGYVWNEGEYIVPCIKCGCCFMGDKRAWNCYDCAKEKLDGRGELIDVWKVSINGTSFTDRTLQNVLDHIKELDDGESITITKKKMGVNEYGKLPEFQGF